MSREPSITIDPTNPARMWAIFADVIDGTLLGKRHGIQTCSRQYSEDYGKTWHTGVPVDDLGTNYLPEDKWGQLGVGSCENTLITSSVNGLVYTATMGGIMEAFDGFSKLPNGFVTSNIKLERSLDAGRTWSAGPTLASYRVDQRGTEASPLGTGDGPNDLAVDRGALSPFRDRVYWSSQASNLDVGGGRRGGGIYLRISSDDGKTVSDPILVDQKPYSITADGSADNDGLRGPKLTFGPQGELYVIYVEDTSGDVPVNILMKVSKDGGKTFSERRHVAPFYAATIMGKIRDPRWLKGQAHMGQVIYNILSVKAAASSDGKLWVVYTSVSRPDLSCQKNAPRFCTNMDVFLVQSADEGRSWSTPVKFTDEKNATDQFRPEIQAHENGTISLAWLDKRNHPDNLGYDVYYTNTRNGVKFLPNVRLSSASSMLAKGSDVLDAEYNMNFTGDWGDSDAVGSDFHYIWSDMRNAVSEKRQIPREIWQAGVRLCGSVVGDNPVEICPAGPPAR